MAGTFELGSLWIAVKDAFTYLTGKSSEKKTNIIEAHKAVNSAFIKTYDYLRNNEGKNIPQPDLAEA